MNDYAYDAKSEMTPDEFAGLGDGHVAYITTISGAEAAEQFGITSEIEADQTLYILHAADGTCMTISDTLEGVEADAWEQNLTTLRVH